MTTFVQLQEDDLVFELLELLHNVGDASRYANYRKKVDDKLQLIKDREEEEEVEVDEELLAEREELLETKLGKQVNKGELRPLYEQLLTLQNRIFECHPDDIEAIWSLAIALLPKTAEKVRKGEERKPNPLVGQIADGLANGTNHPALRIRMLVSLLNSVDEKVHVLSTLLSFTLAVNAPHLLIGSLAVVDEWLTQWKIDREKCAALYLLVSKLYSAARRPSESYSSLFKYLRLVDKPTPETKAAAIEAVLHVLKSPDDPASPQVEYDRLLELPAIESLKGDSLYPLLQIMCSGTVDDYLQWHEKAQATLPPRGLSHDLLLAKMKILTLCSLGSQGESASYESVKNALMLADEDEVEEAVVAAVISGKIEAKLDQGNQTVHFQRTTARCFTKDDWTALHAKLVGWRARLDEIQSTILASTNESSAHS